MLLAVINFRSVYIMSNLLWYCRTVPQSERPLNGTQILFCLKKIVRKSKRIKLSTFISFSDTVRIIVDVETSHITNINFKDPVVEFTYS